MAKMYQILSKNLFVYVLFLRLLIKMVVKVPSSKDDIYNEP
jgi:hypothetical protein